MRLWYALRLRCNEIVAAFCDRKGRTVVGQLQLAAIITAAYGTLHLLGWLGVKLLYSIGAPFSEHYLQEASKVPYVGFGIALILFITLILHVAASWALDRHKR